MFPGILKIKPISARITHNTEKLFGKMDPYVKITIGDKVQQTSAAKGQHMEPFWMDEFLFEIDKLVEISIEVKNQAILLDNIIGTATLNLSDWLDQGHLSIKKDTPLFYKDKDAGSLLLQMTFEPNSTLSQKLPEQSSTELSQIVSPKEAENLVPDTHSEESSKSRSHNSTVFLQRDPVIIKEQSHMIQKEVIKEQPIISTKNRIQSIQPVIKENHFFQENYTPQTFFEAEVVAEQLPFKTEAPLNVEKDDFSRNRAQREHLNVAPSNESSLTGAPFLP